MTHCQEKGVKAIHSILLNWIQAYAANKKDNGDLKKKDNKWLSDLDTPRTFFLFFFYQT